MKKTLLLLAVAALVILAFLTGSHKPRPADPTTQRPPIPAPSTVVGDATATLEPRNPTSSSQPYSATAGATRAWQPVVEGLALAYPNTRGLTRWQWLANQRPYLTFDVLRALAITDLDKVPDGHYAGYEVLRQADETITIRVIYREGWALDLYLTQVQPNIWRVDTLDYTDDFD